MTADDRGRFDPRRMFRSAAKRLKLNSAAKRLSRDVSFRLLDLRARWRRPHLDHVTFVGVTGSCGKTTASALTQAVLANAGHSQGYINEPLVHITLRIRYAILSVEEACRYYVFETATNGPGGLAPQLEILRPRIGVVTTVGSDHRSAFRSLEATAKEKGTLVESLPQDGIAVLNIDDARVAAMAARTKARVVTYGLSPEADVRGSEVACRWPDRLTLKVSHGSEEARVVTRLVGEHWATSILAAIACGVASGVDLATCAKAVASVEPVFGRYSVHGCDGGPTFVLDSIKASSWTIPAGLAFIGAASAPRRTIVFGTISDYAGKAGRVYRRVAREALAAADRVVFVGPHSSHVARFGKGDGGDRLFSFETAYDASNFLVQGALPGELIYIKASRHADHLERLMLAQREDVVCWQQQCRKVCNCFDCKCYRRPSPPFTVADASPVEGEAAL